MTTALPSFPIGGGARVALTARDWASLIAAVEARLEAGRGFTLATLNLDHLVKLRRSAAFRSAYSATDLITADGRPLLALARLMNRPVDLLQGADLIEPLCAVAAERGFPVALYGATDATLAAAGDRLVARHRGLKIVLRRAPPFGFDPEGPAAKADAARIAESGARLCFVAMGAPKQEIFATRAAQWVPGCGFVSIGAGLDFIAGSQTRAPRLVRRLGLEWFWRMASNPRRLGLRYLLCMALLPSLVLDALRMRRAAP
jgi:N-acetylglucosaminyldiphosphoundecaprenol N-acetyl-beta-D-mannosaminyltransferase